MATRTDPRTKEDNVKEKVRYSHFIGSEAFDQGVSHTNVNSDRAILPIVGRHPQGHSLLLIDSTNRVIDIESSSTFRENHRTDYRSRILEAPITQLVITTTELGWVDHNNTPLTPGTNWAGQNLRALQLPYTVSPPLLSRIDQVNARNAVQSLGLNQPITRAVHLGNNLYLSQSQEITTLVGGASDNQTLLPKSHSMSGSYITSRVKKKSRRDIGNFYYGYQPLHNRTTVFKDAMASIKETSPAFDPVKFLTDQIYLETDSYNNDNFISGIVDLGYKADRLVYNWTFTEDQRYPMSILAFGTTEIQKGALGGSVFDNQAPVAPGDFLHYEDVQPFYSSRSHTDQIQASHRLEISYLPEEDSVMPAYKDITARDLFFLDEYLEDVLVNQMTGSLSNDEGFQDPRLRDTAHGFTDYAGRQRDSIVYRNMFR